MLLKIDPKMRPKREGGFTLIEVLISMLLLLLGIAGVLSMQLTSMKATSFSRHATEATIVLEDKMEELSAIKTLNLTDGNDVVNAQALVGTEYTRTWTLSADPTVVELVNLKVSVSWDERGGDTRTIEMDTQRRQQ